MTTEEFENDYYPRYQSMIVAIARRLAKTDHDLFVDLCQEGALALWRCEPKNATRSVDTYINQSIKFRMIDYLRKYQKGDVISIDSLDAAGIQVADTKEGAKIMRYNNASLQLFNEEEDSV